MIENYGFSQTFRQRIQRIYEQATSSVHVNGYISKPLHINDKGARSVCSCLRYVLYPYFVPNMTV
jgi:hypothetical protein